MAVADVEQRGVDALLGDRLAVDERHLERIAVQRSAESMSSTATPMWSMVDSIRAGA